MWLNFRLRNLISGSTLPLAGRTRRGKPAAPRAHLALDLLESRCLLSAGALDPTFGSGGEVITEFQASAKDYGHVAVSQPDNKIVAVGTTRGADGNTDWALARYTASGNLDAGFGTGGRVITDLGSFSDAVAGAALQADGKIVVVGSAF